jgi:WD domain, G-beta repeat
LGNGDTGARRVVVQVSSAVQLDITTAEIYTCEFAPDGTHAMIGAQGNPVSLWDLASGVQVRSYEHSGPVWALGWSRDARTFLSLDGTLRQWDVATGGCVRTFDGHHERTVAWSVDQQRVLTASQRAVCLTDLESGRRRFELHGHSDSVYCAAVDVRGARALSGARDATVRVWDLRTGQCTGVLQGHTYHVHGVAWAADQRHAVSCSRDIRLWDVSSGACVRTFTGHDETIRTVQWSSDQRRLLSAGHDGKVRMWDAQTGRCTEVFEGHASGVVAAAFSRDEQRAFSCDWGGEIRVWDLTRSM